VTQQIGETFEGIALEGRAQNAIEGSRIHEAFQDIVHCSLRETMRSRVLLSWVRKYDERDAGRRSVNEVHGVEGLAEAERQIHKNDFGVDYLDGWKQCRHRGDNGELERPILLWVERMQARSGLSGAAFSEKDSQPLGGHSRRLGHAVRATRENSSNAFFILAGTAKRDWRGQSSEFDDTTEYKDRQLNEGGMP